MLETSPMTETAKTETADAPEREIHPAKKEPSGRRRSSRRTSGKRGRPLVLLLIFLVLSVYGIRTYLFATGYPHPSLTGLARPEYTANLCNLILTGFGLLGLFFLYRGVIALRYLFGVAATVNSLVLAVLITMGLLDGHHGLWLPFHAFAFAVSIFVVWACLISHSAIHFFNNQAERH